MLCKSLAPCANGLAGHANRVGYLAVVQPVGGAQDDLGSLGITARDLAAPNEPEEKIALLYTELDCARLPRLSSHHRPPPNHRHDGENHAMQFMARNF
jgi:hypothetical protein